jgi:hypothetical protein
MAIKSPSQRNEVNSRRDGLFYWAFLLGFFIGRFIERFIEGIY